MENTKLLPLGTEQGLEETEYPSFDLCLGENMVSPLVAQHRQWLKTIRHEVPNPKIPFKVAVYIRFFNQTKYRDEEYLERNKEVFRATLAQYPMWEFVGFYIDNCKRRRQAQDCAYTCIPSRLEGSVRFALS